MKPKTVFVKHQNQNCFIKLKVTSTIFQKLYLFFCIPLYKDSLEQEFTKFGALEPEI
jgi:hypothetical protein